MKDATLPLLGIAAAVIVIVFATAYALALSSDPPRPVVPPSKWAEEYRKHAEDRVTNTQEYLERERRREAVQP